jgi:hypothetical protein
MLNGKLSYIPDRIERMEEIKALYEEAARASSQDTEVSE